VARADRCYIPRYVWRVTHRSHEKNPSWGGPDGGKGSYELRESNVFEANFHAENVDLSQENAFFGDESI
jgi:hypothetical protein